MFTALRRMLRIAIGHRYAEIEEESASRVTLRSDGLSTVFDRVASQLIQNGKLIAAFDRIDRLTLHQEHDTDGPGNWVIALQLLDDRNLQIGTVTDETDASIIAARVAGIVGRPVSVLP